MSSQDYAPKKKISSFYPPQRHLMGPGPSEIHPRVFSAMGKPTIGYLDPVFVEMMEELKESLRYAFQTHNALTFPVSGPGSVGMEMCFVNMINPGDKVIVCRNGVFGGRMIENVQRCGGVAVVVEDRWGTPVDPQKVEDALKANPDAKILAFVHAETSTGVQSDAKALAELARKHGALTIMDAVTSLGGTPVLTDEWGIDAVYSASQKCLSCTPGLSPISFSDRVVEMVKNRKEKVHSWFMDMNLLLGYWGATNRTYHHTAPTNSLYALHEALLMLREEGLENAWARHQRNHTALKAGLQTLGMNYLVEEPYRLPQMNAVTRAAGRGREGSAPPAAARLQPRDRRRSGRSRRQDLALRHHGLLLQDGERDALAVRAGNGVRRSRHQGGIRRRRGCRLSRVRGPSEQGSVGARRRRVTGQEKA